MREHAEVDHIVPIAELAPLLVKLCTEEIEESGTEVPALLEIEADMALMDDRTMNLSDRPGNPSGFSCPDCYGVFWEIRDGALPLPSGSRLVGRESAR